MASKKKLLQAAAGSAGGAGLDVDEVFSTYLYDGTGSTQTITNGIDLSGEGGLVWIKERTNVSNHGLFDTERGVTKYIHSDGLDAEQTGATTLTAFNSNGFSIGSGFVNDTNREICSWTFRKAPKFFDVVTYTGNGSNRTIAHNLGCDVGMIFIKKTDGIKSWAVFHRQFNGGSSPENYWDQLNNAQAIQSNSDIWNNTAPTSSVFSVGTANAVNDPGGTYVAYLFAHNNGDGEFGPDSDQDIIKCGDFQTSPSGAANVNLGFEPQWLIVKAVNDAYNWEMYDVMRGWGRPGLSPLKANTSAAEADAVGERAFTPTSTGFYTSNYWGNNVRMIYMAIRRGPLAEPTSATDVFAVDTNDTTTGDPTKYDSTFTVDMVIQALNKNTSSSNKRVNSRLTGINYLTTNSTAAEGTNASSYTFDTQTGFRLDPGTDVNDIAYMWKRAPSYFDVVAYSGTQVARTISHNLGLNGTVPEMIWVKNRDGTTPWMVYHSALGNQAYLQLNSTAAAVTGNTSRWNATTPTASVFSLGDSGSVNGSGSNYIAYLFATLAGVSKVGSVSHSFNSTTNVDCGFSSGARFVLVKSTATGDWYVWDSVRGIVSGNDPYLALNTTAAEVTNGDLIDPYSGGFALSPSFFTDTYIFYAIA